MKSGISVSIIALPFTIIILTLLQTGCSPVERAGGAVATPEPMEVKTPPTATGVDSGEVLAKEVYDLEEESLEEDILDETTENLEEIKEAAKDSFTVNDLAAPSVKESGFDIGYRVQLLATGDLEKAKELKKKVMAGTGLAVYIDYEDGLYKVRAGDFPEREDASAARSRLVEGYPDCWIVKTTIRK